ncbi:phage capsid protein [Brachyspira catarrhinii]|uniref:Phage capsid protein n=1 Tax=Brachyspira catarrhinii TaxID=2528966 RepID=A0ABY2TPL5_9SPIR|nr:phage capsid protein [Brachyspira catarrhinii]TKZ33619.1 phage capsid protein [Brachyspira catarrhinii]
MIKKRYKILGDSFKQYTFLSANTFTEGKNNIITDRNIDELINSFNNRTVDVFFYKGHKADQTLEREPLGKIIAVYKSDDGIGLDAELELNEAGEEIIKKQGFYPSIEMVGLKTNEDDDNVYWSNCELKAVAAVEYPASKSVELLCASGIIENTEEEKIVQEGGQNMGDKLKELLSKVKTGDAEAKKELLDLIASDEEMGNAVIEVLTKEAESVSEPPAQSEGEKTSEGEVRKVEIKKEPDGTTKEVERVKDTEEKKEDAANLSAITWGKWCDEFAENNEGIRCSSKSESDTFVKAKKLFKAGFSKDEIMDMVKSGLQIIGVSSKTEEVKLSAAKDNKPDFKAISDMFR